MVNVSCLWIIANEMTPTSEPGLDVVGDEEGLDPFIVHGITSARTFVFWVSLRPRESVKSAAISSEPMK